jgi:hypothetical protein
MECAFTSSFQGNELRDRADEVSEIIKHKRRIRICAFSRTFNSHLPWAHYASGFSGLAIEIDLPADLPELKQVTYRGVFANVNMTAPSIRKSRRPKSWPPSTTNGRMSRRPDY